MHIAESTTKGRSLQALTTASDLPTRVAPLEI